MKKSNFPSNISLANNGTAYSDDYFHELYKMLKDRTIFQYIPHNPHVITDNGHLLDKY